MGAWIETYRGAASPWECDITGHFTIAFYFDRIAIAEATLAQKLGLAEMLCAGGFVRRYDVRLLRELHAGGAFHVESAALSPDGGVGSGLRFGHRVVDSVTGEPTAWFDVHWDGVEAVLPAGRLAVWDGPGFERRADPADLSGLAPGATARVGPGDLDECGRIGLRAMVHKFSDAAVQAISAIGLTAAYIETGRRSFSTFELRLRIDRSPRLGEACQVRTGLTHLGNSSMRFLHVMGDPGTGEEIARIGRYGVQLDLDTRRPAPLAPELRERGICYCPVREVGRSPSAGLTGGPQDGRIGLSPHETSRRRR